MALLKSLVVLLCFCGIAWSTDCPDGWMAFEGSCYIFGAYGMRFPDARNYCKKQGAVVAHPHNAEENAFLVDVLKDYKEDDWWVGITDTAHEGTWVNDDTGVVASYFNWADNEPDSQTDDENCAFYVHDWNYEWADVPCDDNNRPICVRRGGAPVVNIG